jgi:phosphatidylcholine synthase
LRRAFWLMAAAVMIDSIDGTFARLARVDLHANTIDGTLMDNILDYLNYVVAPAYLLLQADLVPIHARALVACAIIIASAFQFSQREAKTDDHFFKGFPCYWNITVFYLVIWPFGPIFNLAVLVVLVILVFVPIKYVYPTRLENFSPHRAVRLGFLGVTVLWVFTLIGLLALYPSRNPHLLAASLAYCVFYFLVSIWLNWFSKSPRLHQG